MLKLITVLDSMLLGALWCSNQLAIALRSGLIQL